MNVWLMNSAMMPAPGIYRYESLTAEQFADAVREAHQAGSLVSCIGYPDNIRIIRELTGIDVELSRRQSDVADGDEMLVMKLRYRVQNPASKGRFTPAIEDFEFGRVTYSAARRADEE